MRGEEHRGTSQLSNHAGHEHCLTSGYPRERSVDTLRNNHMASSLAHGSERPFCQGLCRTQSRSICAFPPDCLSKRERDVSNPQPPLLHPKSLTQKELGPVRRTAGARRRYFHFLRFDEHFGNMKSGAKERLRARDSPRSRWRYTALLSA